MPKSSTIESPIKLAFQKLPGDNGFTKDPRLCTHMVASEANLTDPFLQAIPFARHIVTPSWVQQCVKDGAIQSEGDFQLIDSTAESEFNFKLATTIARAKHRKIFSGKTFFFTDGLKAQNKLIKLVEAGGGKVGMLQNNQSDLGRPGFYVISRINDGPQFKPWAEKGVPIYSSRLIRLAMLRQDLTPNSSCLVQAGLPEC